MGNEAEVRSAAYLPQFVRGRKFVRVLWGRWSLTLGWMGPL